MHYIMILQIIVAFLILGLVTFQVTKDSSGLSGLMGNSSSASKNNKIDKPTKYMFLIIMFFIGISFYISYERSETYESVIKQEVAK
jgi:protein translocase SecG subunit